ncbi:MAG TPA: KTSC domain-containing protein, partial [Thermoanaerobaculia bacterium]|nr:KTSC domain-containing protein [Thermoanaerobaculia bacterium]
MEWYPVSSSTLERVSYDSASMTLTIEFKSGTAYQYFDVPQHVFDDLLSAA